MVQQISPIWHPEEFTFEISQEPILKKKSKELWTRVDGIMNSLKRSTKQIVKWLEDLEGEMKLFLASNEYIKWLKTKWPINIEPYVPLSVTTHFDEPYIPEYIVLSTSGVKSYVPEEIVIDVEEWETRAKKHEEVSHRAVLTFGAFKICALRRYFHVRLSHRPYFTWQRMVISCLV